MKIIAHRGYSAQHPENTMMAFRAAWSAGCDGIELDIQITADSHLVVFHDGDGLRLAGTPARVEAACLAELSLWRIGGQPVPDLDSVLKESPCQSTTLIEVKSGAESMALLTTCLRRHPDKPVAVLSFDERVVCSAAAAGWPAWLNLDSGRIDSLATGLDEWSRHGIRTLSLEWSPNINTHLVACVHGAGLKFATWTVNNASDAILAKKAGVDYLMTDDPLLIARSLCHATV